MITTPSNTPIPRPMPLGTRQPKRHPDPLSRFAIIHFADRPTDRQTDRPTGSPGEKPVPRVLYVRKRRAKNCPRGSRSDHYCVTALPHPRAGLRRMPRRASAQLMKCITTSPESNLRRARRSSADKTNRKLLGSHSPSTLTGIDCAAANMAAGTAVALSLLWQGACCVCFDTFCT